MVGSTLKNMLNFAKAENYITMNVVRGLFDQERFGHRRTDYAGQTAD
jgi:hypothetical protein